MFRPLALATLAFGISSAAWAGPGEHFCNVMRQGYLDCGKESMTTNANGQPRMDCPTITQRLQGEYDNASGIASSKLKPELKTALDMWVVLTNHIGPKPGETKDAYVARAVDDANHISGECDKLQALD